MSSRLRRAEDVAKSLAGRFTLTAEESSIRGSSPAERWLVDGGPARVGVIASVTRPFCRTCDRTRLTADGQVRTCLFAREESDLRSALRSGASIRDSACTPRPSAVTGVRSSCATRLSHSSRALTAPSSSSSVRS